MLFGDALGRPIKALRLSVTDRCNFRCVYCRPEDFRFIPHPQILTFEEMERMARIFVSLGAEKIRLTGGEPLVRRHLGGLVSLLKRIDGLRELALTTNGSLLGEQARGLRQAGLDRITVSLDALDPRRFRALMGTDVPLEQVLEGIAAAVTAGFAPVKLNCVVQRGVNEEDVIPLADYARRHGHTLRFIEFMDAGSGNGWRLDRVVPSAELLRKIHATWPLEPIPAPGNAVARNYRYRDGGGEVGFIASVTRPFCQGCDRARLSAEGRLYTCLFAADSLNLRDALRAGADDGTLRRLVQERWQGRDDRYSERRSELTERLPRVEMHHIGG